MRKNWLLIKHKDRFAVKVAYDAEKQNGKKVATPKKTTRRKIGTFFGPINEERKVGSYKVKLTNLQKIFWPDEGFTKGDVIEYYDKISDYILPHLKGRPLSLKRNPNGIHDEGFFHKDAGENAPSYADVFKVKSQSNNKIIDYIVCNNKATLLYLANLGCIEMNPWNQYNTETYTSYLDGN